MSAEPSPITATELPGVAELMEAAVTAIGGQRRDGQDRMADAVHRALLTGEHLAVQAGTGTGKSLAYLVPAIRHAIAKDTTVVVSTATIALQRQLVERDLPRLATALAPLLGREPTFAILKGRGNYLCLQKLHGDAAEPEAELFDPSELSSTGRQIRRIHEWAGTTETGDRDDLVPGVPDAVWRHVSVTARECVGAARCPVGDECFAERAREVAGQADVVVTNHTLLAIDTLEGRSVLPAHDAVIVDEAHELVDRVTTVATAELSGSVVAAAARRCGRLIGEVNHEVITRLEETADGLGLVLADLPTGRWDTLPDEAAGVLAAVQEAASTCRRVLGGERREDADQAAARRMAQAALEEIVSATSRVLEAFEEPDPAMRRDVVWLAETGTARGPHRVLHAAPLSVSGLLRERLFGRSTVVLTSATLTLGGSFEPLARQWGLPPSTGATQANQTTPRDDPVPDPEAPRWSGLDVGSPFDYPRRGILYVARRLPPPGRDGLPGAYLDEIAELIDAAGGRTLGLFSSMRAARQAAEQLRRRLSTPVLCQGEDATMQLVERFAEDPATSLFGTLSLWQGVDVPGPSLSLVIIDRIPFPRPDDPLVTARQRAVDARGGNGFLLVSATHAALLLAQGAGRLLRSASDRGVVAVLDPRLVTARYGGFLRASLPPFWTTDDPEKVRGALRRLRDAG